MRRFAILMVLCAGCAVGEPELVLDGSSDKAMRQSVDAIAATMEPDDAYAFRMDVAVACLPHLLDPDQAKVALDGKTAAEVKVLASQVKPELRALLTDWKK